MTDERSDSLAAQAASWVPPWERAQRPPDPAYAAQARAAAGENDGEELGEADLVDDDDDFDPAFEGSNPARSEGVPPELPPFPEETGGPATVDAPRELPDDVERAPTDIGVGPEVPLPGAIEEAAENEIGSAPTVDAPLDGDDAGDVFDAAADDDVTDDGELDMPFSEEVPGPDEDEESAPSPEDDDESSPAPDENADEASGVAAGNESTPGPDDDVSGTTANDATVLGPDEEDQDAPGTAVNGEADSGPSQDGEAALGPSKDDEAALGPSKDDEAAPRLGEDGESGPGSGEGTAETDAGGSAEPAAHHGADGDRRGGDAEPTSSTHGIPADTPAALRPDEAWALGAADLEAAIAAGAKMTRSKPSSGIPAQTRTVKGAAAASVDTLTRTVVGAEGDGEPAPMDDSELRAALEAILLVVDEPVAELQLAQIVEQPAERVARMLDDISARYTAAGHGFDLRRAAGGWRLYTRPEYAAYVERFVLDGQSVRLTQAALETLAVVAYKQPVTRSRISAIRGVNCDGVMRTLNTRGLIEECGTEGETGAFLYRTTALFLEKLGLNSVDQLPPLAPFLPDDVEEVLDASG